MKGRRESGYRNVELCIQRSTKQDTLDGGRENGGGKNIELCKLNRTPRQITHGLGGGRESGDRSVELLKQTRMSTQDMLEGTERK